LNITQKLKANKIILLDTVIFTNSKKKES